MKKTVNKGEKFGRLTIVKEVESYVYHNTTRKVIARKVLAKCDCGKKVIVSLRPLRAGNVKSCGCYNKDRIRESNTTHGMTSSLAYTSWGQMIQRCNNNKRDAYKYYGPRGIKICKRWYKFNNFIKDMGDRKKHQSLERINNNKDYKPSNCKWATKTEQARNTRKTIFIKLGEEKRSLVEWSELKKINYHTLHGRIHNYGWSEEKAINTPVKKIK